MESKLKVMREIAKIVESVDGVVEYCIKQSTFGILVHIYGDERGGKDFASDEQLRIAKKTKHYGEWKVSAYDMYTGEKGLFDNLYIDIFLNENAVAKKVLEKIRSEVNGERVLVFATRPKSTHGKCYIGRCVIKRNLSKLAS